MKNTRVLLVTGGHAYEREAFLSMFASLEGIQFDEVSHPHAQERFAPASASAYDAMVFYDFGQSISPEARANLFAYLGSTPPKGAVFLHHSVCNYPDWPEHATLVGGFWGSKPFEIGGKSFPASQAKVNQEIAVRICNPAHPITRGMANFQLLDETYNHYYIADDVTPLLETEHPLSERLLGWTRNFGPARVVYLQPGHDHLVYGNPQYRHVLTRAIQWATRKI